MSAKKLTNKKLVAFLMDHKHIDMVTVNKNSIICTVSKKFTPEEVKPLLDATGQPLPRMTSDDGVNYIIFPRY